MKNKTKKTHTIHPSNKENIIIFILSSILAVGLVWGSWRMAIYHVGLFTSDTDAFATVFLVYFILSTSIYASIAYYVTKANPGVIIYGCITGWVLLVLSLFVIYSS